MDMDFHVKSYCQLFDKLQKNVKTVEELFSLLKEQMQEIVRLFPLGKFEIRLIVAPSILDPEGQDERFLLYENEEGFDEPCCREHVQMDETCSAVFEYYPVKGTAWSPIQEQMLLFLSRQLFLLLERVKLVQLLECIDGSADRCSQHPRHQRNRRKTAGTGKIAGVCLCISEH